MKTKIYAMMLLAGGLLASCSDPWEPNLGTGEDGIGQLAISSIDIINSEIAVGRGADDATRDFIVKVFNSDNKQIGEWVYGSMPEIIDLPAGTDYTVRVYSHEQDAQAWEAPYYEGVSEKFNITANNLTNIGTVTARFSNIAVTVRYSSEMFASMGDDCHVHVVANEAGELDFAKNETRTGHFRVNPESKTLVATFSGTLNGKHVTLQKVYGDKPEHEATAGKHYYITYGVKAPSQDFPEETGSVYVDPATGITISIEVDDEYVDGNVVVDDDTLDDSDRPGQEEPAEPVDPTPDPDPSTDPDPTPGDSGISFSSSTIDFNGVNSIVGNEFKVNIVAEEGIAHLVVTISSEDPDFMEIIGPLATPFDLTDPGDLEEALTGFGFPVGSDVAGKTDLDFDISAFIPMLGTFKANALHVFKLTVTDAKGGMKEVSLKFMKY